MKWTPEHDARLTMLADGKRKWTEIAREMNELRPGCTPDSVKPRAYKLGLRGRGAAQRFCVRGHDTAGGGRYANHSCRQCAYERHHSVAYLTGEVKRRATRRYIERYTTWRIRKGNNMKYSQNVDRALAGLGL